MSIALIGRPVKRRIPGGGVRVSGFASFSTTSASGELPIDHEVNRLFGPPIIVPMAAPASGSQMIQYGAGTVSATGAFQMRAPFTGSVSAAAFVVDTTVATDAANIWTVGILNHSNSDAVVVDIATAANSNNSTGGSAFTADTPRALTLGAGVGVTAGDMLEWTFTKASSAANLVELLLTMTFTPTAGGFSEGIYVDESALVAANTSGVQNAYLTPTWNASLSPPSKSITLVRRGANLTSGLKFGFEYSGE